MEETSVGLQVHNEESSACKFSGDVVTLVLTKEESSLQENYKRGVFSIAVTKAKQSSTYTQSKALYPPTQ